MTTALFVVTGGGKQEVDTQFAVLVIEQASIGDALLFEPVGTESPYFGSYTQIYS